MRTATAELVLQASAKVLQDCADGIEVDPFTLEWAATLVLANRRKAENLAVAARSTTT